MMNSLDSIYATTAKKEMTMPNSPEAKIQQAIDLIDGCGFAVSAKDAEQAKLLLEDALAELQEE